MKKKLSPILLCKNNKNQPNYLYNNIQENWTKNIDSSIILDYNTDTPRILDTKRRRYFEHSDK